MEKIHKEGLSNYVISTFRSGVSVPSLIFEYGYPNVNPYMASFVAEQKVFDRLMPRNTSVVIKEGEETLYKTHKYCKENKIDYGSIYFNKKKRKIFPLIKINSWLRDSLFKGQGTVNAYGKIYDPVKMRIGSEGYSKRLIITITEVFIRLIYQVIILFILNNVKFYGSLTN